MKIPRDLKPGDKLWYSKKEYVEVIEDTGAWPKTVYAKSLRRDMPAYMRYWLRDGAEVRFDTPPIIRIERIASKPKREVLIPDCTVKRKAKVDKDAAWLIAFVSARVPMAKPHELKRIRAIARRLNGGKP